MPKVESEEILKENHAAYLIAVDVLKYKFISQNNVGATMNVAGYIVLGRNDDEITKSVGKSTGQGTAVNTHPDQKCLRSIISDLVEAGYLEGKKARYLNVEDHSKELQKKMQAGELKIFFFSLLGPCETKAKNGCKAYIGKVLGNDFLINNSFWLSDYSDDKKEMWNEVDSQLASASTELYKVTLGNTSKRKTEEENSEITSSLLSLNQGRKKLSLGIRRGANLQTKPSDEAKKVKEPSDDKESTRKDEDIINQGQESKEKSESKNTNVDSNSINSQDYFSVDPDGFDETMKKIEDKINQGQESEGKSESKNESVNKPKEKERSKSPESFSDSLSRLEPSPFPAVSFSSPASEEYPLNEESLMEADKAHSPLRPEVQTQSRQQPMPTLGGGDCLFHAIFGQQANGFYEDKDVVRHREELANWIRNILQNPQLEERDISALKGAIEHIVREGANEANDPISGNSYPALTNLRNHLAGGADISESELLSENVIEEYAHMIATSGTYLSQNDAAVIARWANMTIDYEIKNLGNDTIFSETLNERGQSRRTIRFNGSDHYERVLAYDASVTNADESITSFQTHQQKPQQSTSSNEQSTSSDFPSLSIDFSHTSGSFVASEDNNTRQQKSSHSSKPNLDISEEFKTFQRMEKARFNVKFSKDSDKTSNTNFFNDLSDYDLSDYDLSSFSDPEGFGEKKDPVTFQSPSISLGAVNVEQTVQPLRKQPSAFTQQPSSIPPAQPQKTTELQQQLPTQLGQQQLRPRAQAQPPRPPAQQQSFRWSPPKNQQQSQQQQPSAPVPRSRPVPVQSHRPLLFSKGSQFQPPTNPQGQSPRPPSQLPPEENRQQNSLPSSGQPPKRK
jgi:hypothetical protein